MNTENSDIESIDTRNLNLLSDTYNSAFSMIEYEGLTFWRATSVYLQFTFILIAGSVFPTFINTAEPKTVSIIGLVISVLGLFITISWLSLVSRARKYQHYWILSARELEQFLPEPSRFLTRGELFSDGNIVSVNGEKIRFTSYERIRMGSIARGLYFAFTGIYLGLIILNSIRIVQAY